MGCNCKWTEIVLAIVILVFVFWVTTASQWIVAIAAILLLIHALMCKNCAMCSTGAMPMKAKSGGKKKKRR
jgi:hypothetical protein